MSNIKYVIRRQHFLHHDDYDINSATGSTIHSIHTDKDAAMAVWKKLVVDTVRENDLSHYNIQDRINENVLKEADQYLQAQLGMSLFSEYGHLIECIPHHLNDDATFELAKKLRFLHYQLYEFIDTDYYVVWLPDDKLYLRFGHPFDPDNYHQNPDYYINYVGRLIYGTNENFIAENEIFYERLIFRTRYTPQLTKPFDKFSDNPELLKQVLDDSATSWKIDKWGFLEMTHNPKYQEIIAINNLLKEPLFEIRKIDFDTLIELFNQEHEGC